MSISILTTGGTIDKVYFDAKSEYQVGESRLSELLSEANVCEDYTLEQVLRKE